MDKRLARLAWCGLIRRERVCNHGCILQAIRGVCGTPVCLVCRAKQASVLERCEAVQAWPDKLRLVLAELADDSRETAQAEAKHLWKLLGGAPALRVHSPGRVWIVTTDDGAARLGLPSDAGNRHAAAVFVGRALCALGQYAERRAEEPGWNPEADPWTADVGRWVHARGIAMPGKSEIEAAIREVAQEKHKDEERTSDGLTPCVHIKAGEAPDPFYRWYIGERLILTTEYPSILADVIRELGPLPLSRMMDEALEADSRVRRGT